MPNTHQIVADDQFLRNFMHGTWHGMFVSELIIKRRQNVIILAGLVSRRQPAQRIYFLQGYTERLLSVFLRQPIRIEIQTVEDNRDVIFKYI